MSYKFMAWRICGGYGGYVADKLGANAGSYYELNAQ